MKPRTHYTKSGRINIAYQVIGEGPIDIVYIPGWVSNIDLMWSCPSLVSFLQGLASIGRVILFDKRGTGLSDRVIELSTIEERMDDIRAVMDAVGSEQAALFGHSEGGSVSALFAATYPERTIALITFGVFAKRRWSPDYPWAPTEAERQKVYEMIENDWGSGDMDLNALAPSMQEDVEFMNWLADYFRSGASPSAALALTKMNTEVDIIDILDTIVVPTLLMCRTDDIDAKVDESKFMAQHIKNSKFVEFDGNDHLFWVGDTHEVLDEITQFLTGSKHEEKFERKLASILFVELSDSLQSITELGEQEWLVIKSQFDDLMRKTVLQYRGKQISKSKNVYLSTFDGPSKAVHCAIAVRQAISGWNIKIRQVCHTGECVITQNDDISGRAVQIAYGLLDRAKAGDILITQTVKNLLSGAGLEYSNVSSIALSGISDPIQVLLVQDEEEEEIEPPHEAQDPVKVEISTSVQNHSFLENVLQSIETHMSNESYGVDMLCKELRLSERQLQRKLKRIANKTPNQMVRSVRLHKAKEILMLNQENISEAAYSTGFNSLSYFAKCFKKEFGVAPSDLLVT